VRIEELRLPAYGPFTATEFDFSAGRGRLEVIYGSNEAGKTSLLRGISALLFGIPGQSRDAFLHPYGDLRIGATLEHDGKRLAFIRRKGNKNTLRHADDQTLLTDGELQAFVPIASEQFFRLMFGLDAQRLAEGGEELLSGRGEFGSMLFGASTGIVGLRKIQDSIVAGAEKIFKPKAHTTSLQLVLARRENSRKVLRDASVSAPFLEELFAKQAQAAADREVLREAIENRRADLVRFDRLKMAMGLLNRRRRCLEELESLGPVLVLREALADEFEIIAHRTQAITASLAEAEQVIQSLEESLKALEFHPPLLAAQQRIKALHKRLGAELKAQEDRPKLTTELRGFENGMKDLLRSLGEAPDLAAVPALRVPAPEAELAASLIERSSALESTGKHAQADEAELVHEMAALQAQRASLPAEVADDALQQAADKLLTVGDLDVQLPLRRVKLAKDEAKLLQKVLALPWQGGLDQLAIAQCPAEALVHHWKLQLNTAARSVETARESLHSVTQEVEGHQAAIQRHQAGRQLSTLKELEASRGHRELGWRAVRHAWLDSNIDTPEAREFLSAAAESITLASAFEGSVANSDRLADDLRAHATEVAQLAQMQADLASAGDRLSARTLELTGAEERYRKLREEWAALWAPVGVSPAAPEQMLDWLSSRQKLVDQSEALSDQHRVWAEDSARLLAAREEVRLALGATSGQQLPPEVPFGELKAAAGMRLKQSNDERQRRQTLLTQLQTTEQKLAKSRLNLGSVLRDKDSWNAQWGSLLDRLQLTGSKEPAVIKKTLALRDQLAKNLDEATQRQGRIDSIDRDTREFEAQVSTLALEAAPDLKFGAAADAVDQLHERLLSDLKTRELRQEKQKELATRRDQCQTLLAESAFLTSQMQALVVETGCESVTGLPVKIRQSSQRRDLEKQRLELEDQLLNISGNCTLAELEAQAAALSPDMIPGRVEELNCEITDKSTLRDQALKDEDSAAKEIAALANRLDAASAASDLQNANAEILEFAEEFVRLTMAGQILRKAVEEYGNQASGPMLTRSSAVFAKLTRNSFCRLQLDVDSDRTILVGVHADGKLVPLDGMSAGTRDQLYLALRVASLELYFEQQAPVPLILDDVLVQFDDERAASALEVLADLASKSQVLLFTHHPHLVELARSRLTPESIKVYRFGASFAAG